MGTHRNIEALMRYGEGLVYVLQSCADQNFDSAEANGQAIPTLPMGENVRVCK